MDLGLVLDETLLFLVDCDCDCDCDDTDDDDDDDHVVSGCFSIGKVSINSFLIGGYAVR